jgi:acyl-CoA reductase-like NAD-dependent aldehyde dehydrogenase
MSSTTEILLTVVERAPGRRLAEVSTARVVKADAAIQRARGAFRAWREVSPADRRGGDAVGRGVGSDA